MTWRNRSSRAGIAVADWLPCSQSARLVHRRVQPQHGRGRRGRAVECPREPAKGDHAGAHRGRRKRYQATEREAAVSRGTAERPEHGEIGGDDDQQAPQNRPLAQASRLPEKVGEPAASGREAFDDPVGQSEQSQLLGGWRIDGQPVGVVGMPLRVAHFFGVAVAPDGTLAEHPVR